MKKKLINGNSRINTLTPKLTSLTRVSPDNSFINQAIKTQKMRNLHEENNSHVAASALEGGARRSGRNHHHSARQGHVHRRSRRYLDPERPGIERPPGFNDPDLIPADPGTDSDIAESPAAFSIQSSYKSPVFQHYVDITPCPVDGCPLNPQVSEDLWRL